MAPAVEPPGQGGEEELDELPTLPPAPAEWPARLRWATREPTPPPPSPSTKRKQPAPRALPPAAAASLGRQVPPTLPVPPVGRAAEPAVRATRGAPPPSRRWRWLLALAAVLVVAGAAVFVAVGAVGKGSSGAPAAARKFESLLGQLSSSDALASRAASTACLRRPPGSGVRERALSTLRSSELAAQGVLALLSSERAALVEWPPGRVIYGDLASLTRLVLDKGADLEAWLSGLQATGCYSAPANNLFYTRALQAASAERVAARQLLVDWAPSARRYHLATFREI